MSVVICKSWVLKKKKMKESYDGYVLYRVKKLYLIVDKTRGWHFGIHVGRGRIDMWLLKVMVRIGIWRELEGYYKEREE